MVLVGIIVAMVFVVWGMMKLADKVFVDRDLKPANKVDLTYNPLAVDDGLYFHGPVKIGPTEGEPAITEEQAKEYLDKLRAEIKASGKRYDPLKDEWVPTRCMMCGEPMKREQVGQATVETCDCPGRGYQPRS